VLVDHRPEILGALCLMGRLPANQALAACPLAFEVPWFGAGCRCGSAPVRHGHDRARPAEAFRAA